MKPRHRRSVTPPAKLKCRSLLAGDSLAGVLAERIACKQHFGEISRVAPTGQVEESSVSAPAVFGTFAFSAPSFPASPSCAPRSKANRLGHGPRTARKRLLQPAIGRIEVARPIVGCDVVGPGPDVVAQPIADRLVHRWNILHTDT